MAASPAARSKTEHYPCFFAAAAESAGGTK